MQKLRGTIDRFEGEKAVIRVSGEDVVVPKSYLKGFSEGDVVALTVANETEDTEDSAKVAEALVADLFKEE